MPSHTAAAPTDDLMPYDGPPVPHMLQDVVHFGVLKE
jgi:hypothetical protein